MIKLVKIFCAASALILSACRADLVPDMQEGALQVSLGYVSSSVVETKATPENLVKPDAGNFQLNIVNKDRGNTLYNGSFTDTPIKAAPGNYTVSVQAGEDVEIGYDSPFYTGSADAHVPVDATVPTPVNIQCKVANSLISVVFGGDALERSRFSALFEECEMIVDIGRKKISIDMPGQSRSVYLRAGQDFTLSFRGILKKDPDHTVFAYLNAEGLPSSLGAADHLIITLTPSHESGAGIEISKIELVEAEIGCNIPFSWLPVPKVNAQHVFDQDGTLLGTKLETESSFPGCEWSTSICNSSGNVVRNFSGTGSLSSDYTDINWPYLPAGDYIAKFSYIYKGNEVSYGKTYNFSVPSPESLKLTLEGGFTSYTLYTDGDISNANKCDKGTIYAPAAKISVSDAILKNSNYRLIPVAFSSLIDGTQISSTQHKNANACEMGNATNLQSRAEAYTYTVTGTFDGTSASASKEFYITGLPVTYNPPSDSYGWSWINKRDGEWKDDHVKLATGAIPASEARTPDYHLPDDVNVKVTSDLDQYGSFLGIKCEYEVKFAGYNKTESKTTDNPRDFYYNDGTLKKGVDYITVKNTYVAAGYYLRVYTVKIEYR